MMLAKGGTNSIGKSTTFICSVILLKSVPRYKTLEINQAALG